jgi:hypothetical protein
MEGNYLRFLAHMRPDLISGSLDGFPHWALEIRSQALETSDFMSWGLKIWEEFFLGGLRHR